MRTTMMNIMAVLVFLLATCRGVMAQCDNCPTPQVVIYGLQMNVPMPAPDDSATGAYTSAASQQALLNWIGLGDAIVPLGAISNNDPEASCVRWSQGSLANQLATLPDSLVKIHLENYWTGDVPPAGQLAGVDYLIWATLDSSGGAYHFHVYLEDGYTRDRIASGSADFTSASGAVAAANTAIAAIEPVFDNVRQYQKNLRDNNTNMALSAQINVIPSQSNMDAMQTIPVTFQVTDCDGTPLKNVTLQIKGTQGTFDNSSIVTDDNGEATANFTANNVTAVANLTAIYFPYTTPTHKQRGSHGSGIVTINNPNTKVWEEDITENRTFHDHNVNDIPAEQYFSYYDDSYGESGNLKKYIVATITDTSYVATVEYPGTGEINGSETKKSITDESSLYENTNSFSTSWVSKDETFLNDFGVNGYKLPGQPPTFFFASELSVDETTELQTFEKTPNGTNTTENTTNLTDIIDAYPSTFATNPADPHVTSSFSGSAGGYTFSGNYSSDTTIVHTPNWSETANTEAHVTVSITPYRNVTAIKNYTDNAPKTFQLFANYPNPFNPSTMISYQIPMISHVTLKVYDILGRQVATLVDQKQDPGKYGVKFDGSRLSSGVYFYRLNAGAYTAIKKMALVK